MESCVLIERERKQTNKHETTIHQLLCRRTKQHANMESYGGILDRGVRASLRRQYWSRNLKEVRMSGERGFQTEEAASLSYKARMCLCKEQKEAGVARAWGAKGRGWVGKQIREAGHCKDCGLYSEM